MASFFLSDFKETPVFLQFVRQTNCFFHLAQRLGLWANTHLCGKAKKKNKPESSTGFLLPSDFCHQIRSLIIFLNTFNYKIKLLQIPRWENNEPCRKMSEKRRERGRRNQGREGKKASPGCGGCWKETTHILVYTSLKIHTHTHIQNDDRHDHRP